MTSRANFERDIDWLVRIIESNQGALKSRNLSASDRALLMKQIAVRSERLKNMREQLAAFTGNNPGDDGTIDCSASLQAPSGRGEEGVAKDPEKPKRIRKQGAALSHEDEQLPPDRAAAQAKREADFRRAVSGAMVNKIKKQDK